MAEIGKRNKLVIVRMSTPGLYLNAGDLGEILMPRRYILPRMKPGDILDVFVYRDSEDRLVATTETPHAAVNEFACMQVLSVNDRVGAFLDWGLSKDLLLPFREQEFPVKAGQWVVAYVGLDPRTERIIASTHLKRHLDRSTPTYWEDQAVPLLITRKSSLGYECIVEGKHLGMLFQHRSAPPLQIGQKVKGFVRTVRPDGKIDLSLDASGYKRVTTLTDVILEALRKEKGALHFDDDSSPELIRRRFDVSKKAFKQALGALYRARKIEFLNPGIKLVETPEPDRKK